jgi:phospholipase/carboxylesterase
VSLRFLTRPAAGEPDGALVLLHGRGADEHDLFPLLDILDPERRLAGFTPRGPLSFPPGGAHWYALYQLGQPDPATFDETFPRLVDWLDGFGFPPERTVLGGFSQGAVMTYALSLAAGRPRPAAAIALSGFVPTVPGLELDVASAPPFAIGHGTFDPVIGVEWSRRARELLGDAVRLYRESPLPHTIDPAFLPELQEFVSRSVPARTPSRAP